MDLFGIPATITLVVYVGLVVVKVYAFFQAMKWGEEYYSAAGKWNRNGWVIVTGVSATLQLAAFSIGIPVFLTLGLTIATLVFLADVKPALDSLKRR